MREVFKKADSRLEFTVDPDPDRVVKVMDGDSGTVRQIPHSRKSSIWPRGWDAHRAALAPQRCNLLRHMKGMSAAISFGGLGNGVDFGQVVTELVGKSNACPSTR